MNGLALCAGIGGIDLGLKLACPGYRTVCYVEGEAYAASVLIRRMEEGWLDKAPVWSDIRTFNGGLWCRAVDIVTAGFPCQSFSVAGVRRGEADERNLWPEVRRVVGEVGPRYVLLENVPGLLADEYFGTILGEISDLGYNAEWDVFSAGGLGANHLRRRLFILAYSQGEGLPEPQGPSREEAGQPRPECGAWREAEPGICRVDDGTPFSVDRIRALGNAVVPAVAAEAWWVLSGRI